MSATSKARSAGLWLAGGAGVAIASYTAYAGYTWLRYDHAQSPSADEGDPLLDHFMPRYEVAERHHVRVAAPADVTLAAALQMDLQSSPIVRAIFKTREWIMRSHPPRDEKRRGFLDEMRALGWGPLAGIPDREIVMGAVTQPWKADVVFRPLPPEEFTAFADPDYAKIVWTLRADPVSATESIFRTETRVATTNREARAKFRRYWALLSPGIILIRRVSLAQVRVDAEQGLARFRPPRCRPCRSSSDIAWL